MTAHRVLIVEDHELLAQSLAVALEVEGLEVVVAPLQDGPDLLATAEAARPAVVLLDLDLGQDREGGEALVPGLTGLGARVVVVSGSSDVLRLGTCLELGAAGVLSKSLPFEDVLEAVRRAASGERVMQEAARLQLLADMRRARAEQRSRLAPFERLTPREAEVLVLLMQGLAADAVAKYFVVSEATVRTQIRGILTKVGVSSQLAAVAEAHRVGWTRPG
ncbi:MAG: response regulator containing a CheY-like receiver domain and an DNA-binding domain [Frankiales bacterium]|nr:response regulator containing a CheY-like receiver domain and an DNA-binding domain [Frankiales bacterium]